MSAVPFARLRRMTPDEISWRVRCAGRTAADRVSVRLRAPRWDREDLRRVLAEGLLTDLLPRNGAGASWDAIQAELGRLIGERDCLFALDPASCGQLRAEIGGRWPAAAGDAAARADSVIAGHYDVLGYKRLSWTADDGGVDWHLDPVTGRRAPTRFWADVPYLDPAIGDHKVVWELNRHQHWLQLGRALWLTGSRDYRDEMVRQLRGWMSANPPLVGINWASMLEIGLRAMSWVWGMHFLLPYEPGFGTRDPGSDRIRNPDRDSDPDSDPDPESRTPDPDPWLIDMLVGLDRQLSHLERNLSVYFSPNTHLTGEALGLYVAGVALPELSASARWKETGRRVLVDEIARQIHADGGHAERSTHYQRYTLDFYLMALVTAERDGDRKAAATFRDAVQRLAEYTRAIADDEGRLPLIGDDDGGMLWPMAGRACHDVRDSLSIAATLVDRSDLAPWGLQEEAVWIAGLRALDRERLLAPAPAPPPASSRTFPNVGFVVVRDPAGDHAAFDVGRHGFLNGGHAHAGALSITLTLRRQPFLIDPGTSTYTMDARLRDRLRSSMSHNTVTVDDRSQAVPSGPFHWLTRAHAQLHGSRSNDAFDWAEAWHDGFGPVQHRRTLVRTAGGGWLIADEMLGEGEATARAHWHMAPGWTLRCDTPRRLLASHGGGLRTWLLHDADEVLLAHGDDESGLGFYAPVYGVLVPTWTVRATRRGPMPFTLLAWIAEPRSASSAAPTVERIVPVGDANGIAIGIRVADDTVRSVFLLRPGEPIAREGRTCTISEYETDARVLHCDEAGGRLTTLDVIDAVYARALRSDWITIEASDPVSDFHAAFADDVLDLRSSRPPALLRLHGDALRGVRSILLNRRPIDLPAFDGRRAIVLSGTDWATEAALPKSLVLSA
jgi:hypothetical protein